MGGTYLSRALQNVIQVDRMERRQTSEHFYNQMYFFVYRYVGL